MTFTRKSAIPGIGATRLLLVLLVAVAVAVGVACQKSDNPQASAAPEPTTASSTSTSPSTSAPAAAGALPVGDVAKPPFGFLDSPKEGASVKPGTWSSGWALDDSGIADVTVRAEDGTTSLVARNQSFPGVAQAYPGYRNADKAGVGFPVPKLSPGAHTLTVTLIARDGGRTEIRRQIRVP